MALNETLPYFEKYLLLSKSADPDGVKTHWNASNFHSLALYKFRYERKLKHFSSNLQIKI